MQFDLVHCSLWRILLNTSQVGVKRLMFSTFYMYRCLLYLGGPEKKWTEDTIQIMSSALKNIVDWRLKDKAEALSKSVTKQ